MNQDQLKERVAREALKYVQDPVIGVGSGSTVLSLLKHFQK
jgi:ribose 5-phosphate isomerase